MYIKLPVSGHSATDKTPMYEMPLIYVFGGWGFGVGESTFCIGVLGNGILSLAFCPEIGFLVLHQLTVQASTASLFLCCKLGCHMINRWPQT